MVILSGIFSLVLSFIPLIIFVFFVQIIRSIVNKSKTGNSRTIVRTYGKNSRNHNRRTVVRQKATTKITKQRPQKSTHTETFTSQKANPFGIETHERKNPFDL